MNASPRPPAPVSQDEFIRQQMLLQTSALTRIASALEALVIAQAPREPNYRRPLGEFAAFDWSSIGATVAVRDEFGPTTLDSLGYLWSRRSPNNKYGEAIWFSRPIGKDADGHTRYLCLIKFELPSEAEPVPDKVQRAAQPPATPRDWGRSAPQSVGSTGGAPRPGHPPPPPAPASAPAAPRPIVKGERDSNKVSAALKAGAALDDVAYAVNGVNGPTLFWGAARHWFAPVALTDAAQKQNPGNWAAAILALRPAVDEWNKVRV